MERANARIEQEIGWKQRQADANADMEAVTRQCLLRRGQGGVVPFMVNLAAASIASIAAAHALFS